MAKSPIDSKKLVHDVLDYIQKTDPENFQKISDDPTLKNEIVSTIRKTIEDELKLQEDLKHHKGDITKLNLPSEELSDIKDGLKMATFRVHIDEDKAVLKHLDGKTFKTIELNSKDNINGAQAAQIASIVIEAVLLALNIIGVKVPISQAVIVKATSWVENEYGSNAAFRLAVDTFIKAWKSAPGDNTAKAKALFELLVAMHKLGLFWALTKILLSEVPLTEWLKISAKITAILIAAFATDGIALIAKITLALSSAYAFAKKLDNLQILDQMKSTY